MRPAGAHGGLGLARVDSADDLEVLDAFALDGRPYYATEFRDFRSADGLYRKHRVIVIGGKAHARHVIVSNTWNIHSESRDVLMASDAALRAEEERFLATFDADAWPMFERFASLLELDYFGVDFGIDADGKMVVFEVNACVRAMVTGVETGYHAATLSAIKAGLVAHIERRAAAES
jgi:glutathione synthase/RimK-type ligase-like ATP-grasp enzyme